MAENFAAGSRTAVRPPSSVSAYMVSAYMGLLCALSGCSGGPSDMPDLAPVSGVVTLDEAPLVGKDIVFSPAGGRPSMGRTDENGSYELWYTVDHKGAIIGAHDVHFATPRPANADPDRPWEETLPLKFTAESEITAQVKDTSNAINFDLKTESE